MLNGGTQCKGGGVGAGTLGEGSRELDNAWQNTRTLGYGCKLQVTRQLDGVDDKVQEPAELKAPQLEWRGQRSHLPTPNV